MTFVPAHSGVQPRPRGGVLRWLMRSALLIAGLAIVVLGVLIAPLPGPGGIPVIALGLVLVLRNSFWAKRQFIRAQYARRNTSIPSAASCGRIPRSRRCSGSRPCAQRSWCLNARTGG